MQYGKQTNSNYIKRNGKEIMTVALIFLILSPVIGIGIGYLWYLSFLTKTKENK
jgi:Kef-type K+ transport system membrane component KefB